MKVLIIKTSSLGDLIHTLPAVTDAAKAIPGITFDWVAEENFAEIPSWHPAVNKVIPIAIRRWRKNWKQAEVSKAVQEIRREKYDAIIDAQGLIKSAIITRFAKGGRYGLDKASCKEPLASLAYQHKINIPRDQHAIERVRQLFAKALGYQHDETTLDYGLDRNSFKTETDSRYLVFLHGTTWESKLYPEQQWVGLAQLAYREGLKVCLPWGNEEERQRAERCAKQSSNVIVPERMPLTKIAALLAASEGVIGCDTGLTHLSAALNIPGITLYGSTSSELTGTKGNQHLCLQAEFKCAPCMQKQCRYKESSAVASTCYQSLPAEMVWDNLQQVKTW
jgi:heptosyltransferase-1